MRNVKTLLGSGSGPSASGFKKARSERELFPATSADVDGPDCLHDCESCTAHYPARFRIDEDDKLYGQVRGWNTHLIVGTGKTDWVRDVTDEKGSVMEAVGRVGLEAANGKVMLSASNMPPGHEDNGLDEGASTCLLLPAWILIESVRPHDVPELMRTVVGKSVTSTTLVEKKSKEAKVADITQNGEKTPREERQAQQNGSVEQPDQEAAADDGPDVSQLHIGEGNPSSDRPSQATLRSIPSKFKTRPCPHSYLILLCSHKTRDARCGQSAPLLRKEFERHLRPLGLYRDLQDERPGGVGIYFINHVGGHKYAANVLVYRREGAKGDGTNGDTDQGPLSGEAAQFIWLARVGPKDCENIIKYTVLQGKVVKPQKQLRGGFDRERGLTSW